MAICCVEDKFRAEAIQTEEDYDETGKGIEYYNILKAQRDKKREQWHTGYVKVMLDDILQDYEEHEM